MDTLPLTPQFLPFSTYSVNKVCEKLVLRWAVYTGQACCVGVCSPVISLKTGPEDVFAEIRFLDN